MKSSVYYLIVFIILASCISNKKQNACNQNSSEVDTLLNILAYQNNEPTCTESYKKLPEKTAIKYDFDPLIIRIQTNNNKCELKELIEKTDSMIFFEHQMKGNPERFEYYQCNKYQTLLNLLNTRDVKYKTLFLDSSGNTIDVKNGVAPERCESFLLQKKANKLMVEAEGNKFNFPDENIYVLSYRKEIDNKLFGVYINDNNFIIASWNTDGIKYHLNGVTCPVQLTTLMDFNFIDDIYKIDSLNYLIAGKIPEIDYMDGPSQLKDFQHIWISLLRISDDLIFLSDIDSKGNKQVTPYRKFRTYFADDDYSSVQIKELTASRAIFKFEYGQCIEVHNPEEENVPVEELEGQEPECNMETKHIVDTLNLDMLKRRIVLEENK